MKEVKHGELLLSVIGWRKIYGKPPVPSCCVRVVPGLGNSAVGNVVDLVIIGITSVYVEITEGSANVPLREGVCRVKAGYSVNVDPVGVQF